MIRQRSGESVRSAHASDENGCDAGSARFTRRQLEILALLKAGKANKEAEAATAEADLAIEVDGQDDNRRETDVSAFVDVLAKRGFVLRGEPAESVDLGNRMFVKMYFVKAATPVKGKGVAAAHSRDAAYKPRPAAKQKKFIEGDAVEVNEAAVLKPCVYKIR